MTWVTFVLVSSIFLDHIWRSIILKLNYKNKYFLLYADYIGYDIQYNFCITIAFLPSANVFCIS